MSDNKAPASSDKDDGNNSKNEDVPMVTQKVEPKSNFAKAAEAGKQGKGESRTTGDQKGTTTPPRTRAAKKGRGWIWFWLFVLLLIGAAVAAWHLIPGVRQQMSQQLQQLPVVGKHFASDATSSAQSADTRSTSARDQAESPSTVADQTPPRDSSNSAYTAGNQQTTTSGQAATNLPSVTAPATTGTDTQQVTQAAPEQSGQPPVPSATSPVPPYHQNTQLISELRQQLTQQNQTIEQLQQQLAGLQRNVTAQGNRLSQLGNASREDWQLAEADYLLRLANQRLMLEQDSRAALGLLQQVDTIFRNVDLQDLYGVRQQLARDITALKLAEDVDREGLYLQLRALEEQMIKLNIQPKFDLAKRDAATAQAQADNTDVGEAHFRSSWDNFVSFLKDSVRIRDAELDPVLLSPQSETRFRQSLRLNMEQAELAVLRADETVYIDALKHARQLLVEYGIDTPQRQAILRELEALSQQKIQVDLPNLNGTQSALRNYIDRLHKVSSGQSPETTDGGSLQ
ncbi:uroporphyrinogen-III C-methyltransferase [Microbulbifer bruguierae]|uniref:Uroporphyrinogen-III C-methyltransferase n=1 Tax=Microbulbifer bruguierae TaxID=3029061 RepID=A0ABY8N891_9GAMM|nr:uroporphyrinogen-III C-methyltransferase [Microbulbifer bruguierae]WGL15119.1 uroporphyrinogen-III C-methyltransferase [Microbulbifer bruguierae]